MAEHLQLRDGRGIGLGRPCWDDRGRRGRRSCLTQFAPLNRASGPGSVMHSNFSCLGSQAGRSRAPWPGACRSGPGGRRSLGRLSRHWPPAAHKATAKPLGLVRPGPVGQGTSGRSESPLSDCSRCMPRSRWHALTDIRSKGIQFNHWKAPSPRPTAVATGRWRSTSERRPGNGQPVIHWQAVAAQRHARGAGYQPHEWLSTPSGQPQRGHRGDGQPPSMQA